MKGMKHIAIVGIVVGIAAAAAFVVRPAPSVPAPAEPASPAEDGGTEAPTPDGSALPLIALGQAFTLAVGDVAALEEDLTVTLVRIDDSRCPPDVQCVWEGELSATLAVQGGELGTASQEAILGQRTRQTTDLGPYVLSLVTIRETDVTLSVDRR
jgi:hypothetical protein